MNEVDALTRAQGADTAALAHIPPAMCPTKAHPDLCGMCDRAAS